MPDAVVGEHAFESLADGILLVLRVISVTVNTGRAVAALPLPPPSQPPPPSPPLPPPPSPSAGHVRAGQGRARQGRACETLGTETLANYDEEDGSSSWLDYIVIRLLLVLLVVVPPARPIQWTYAQSKAAGGLCFVGCKANTNLHVHPTRP